MYSFERASITQAYVIFLSVLKRLSVHESVYMEVGPLNSETTSIQSEHQLLSVLLKKKHIQPALSPQHITDSKSDWVDKLISERRLNREERGGQSSTVLTEHTGQ